MAEIQAVATTTQLPAAEQETVSDNTQQPPMPNDIPPGASPSHSSSSSQNESTSTETSLAVSNCSEELAVPPPASTGPQQQEDADTFRPPSDTNSKRTVSALTPRPTRVALAPSIAQRTPEFKHRKRNLESILTPKANFPLPAAPVNGAQPTNPGSKDLLSFQSPSTFPVPPPSKPVLRQNNAPKTPELIPQKSLLDATPASSSNAPFQFALTNAHKEKAQYEAELRSLEAKYTGSIQECAELKHSIQELSGQFFAACEQIQKLQSSLEEAASAAVPPPPANNDKLFTEEQLEQILHERMEKWATELHAQYSAKHTQKINAFKANYAKKYESTIQELQNQVNSNALILNSGSQDELTKELMKLRNDNETLRMQLESAVHERQKMTTFLTGLKTNLEKNDQLLQQQQVKHQEEINNLNKRLGVVSNQLTVERQEREQVMKMSEDLLAIIDKLEKQQQSS
ncbi:centrosomal transforming acidic coiled-coil protein Alp7 [Schizosaccharomyces japonicus yFS275]|uniref:Centrosomal transforming acidic coiled-coil protein Alp7 n=1 Tax=Schizosaccharomyces japonicus (strain yFS275 / FY16936) TaxID=402676 RepID=B6K139_SCHJY|nr:centrosomal transforming acidic coiled-coil protein Alp7 [Schizosaccharomyces japonicus yFS275]EEB07660.1 centrosomal transforming acidic coiled-coil protein Alp7 [Schizosaccharomyces japonicus yFS275]